MRFYPWCRKSRPSRVEMLIKCQYGKQDSYKCCSWGHLGDRGREITCEISSWTGMCYIVNPVESAHEDVTVSDLLQSNYLISCLGQKDGDRLCGLVVRLAGWRPRGPAFDSLHYQIFWIAVGLERGPLSPPWPLVRERTIPTERPPLVGEI
jgi:hypothetical protein